MNNVKDRTLNFNKLFFGGISNFKHNSIIYYSTTLIVFQFVFLIQGLQNLALSIN